MLQQVTRPVEPTADVVDLSQAPSFYRLSPEGQLAVAALAIAVERLDHEDAVTVWETLDQLINGA